MIAGRTTMTRASAYNYFSCKEEAFQALLRWEYGRWNADLGAVLVGPALDEGAFVGALAASSDGRPLLPRLMSANHYDMEGVSGPEALAEFKGEYDRSYGAHGTSKGSNGWSHRPLT